MGEIDLKPQNNIKSLSALTGTREERREKIQAFEDNLKTMEDAEPLTDLKHAFLDGAYFRQISIPAGIALTGAIHSGSTINMLTKGKFAIVTEFDEQIIEAPFMYISKPGTKKACYTIEDCIFINCHTTWKTDIDEIRAEVIQEEYSPEIDCNEVEKVCHGG